MGEALSYYANNEQVERVELIASIGGASTARLHTVKGNSFEVPASILKLAAVNS